MDISITRLVDGKQLPALEFSKVQIQEDAFGSSRSQSTAVGFSGETVSLSSSVDSKTITITWISTDESGYEQSLLRRFFGSDEPYEITADSMRLVKVWGTVIETETPDWLRTSVSFSTRFGTDVIRLDYPITSASYSSFDDPSYDTLVVDDLSPSNNTDVALQITLESAESALWFPGTGISVMVGVYELDTGTYTDKSFYFTIGAQDSYGAWNQTQKRKSIVLDTTRLILGSGYYDPTRSNFYTIPPNAAASGQIQVIPNSYYGQVCDSDWEIKIDFVYNYNTLEF